MSQLDVRDAKTALAVRLRDWGVQGNATQLAAGFIDDLVNRGWQMNPTREDRPRPPKVVAACRTCGHDVERCGCDNPTSRPVPRDPDGTYAANVAHARGLLHPRGDTA